MLRILMLFSATFPIPLFYDLYYQEFVISELPFGHETRIPIPIGFFCLFVTLTYMSFYRLILKGKVVSLFDKKEVLVISAIISCLFYHGYFISGLSFIRLIQIIIPLIFFIFICLPDSVILRGRFFNIALYSMMVLVLSHLISFISNGYELFNISSHQFPMLFGFSIYQSLISYTAVLSLYLTLFLYLYFNSKSKYIYIAPVCIIIYLLLTSARKVSLIEMCFILSFLLISIFFIRKNKHSLFYWIERYITISLGAFFYIFLLNNTSSVNRFFESLHNDTFTGGRDLILNRALDAMSDNIFGFLFGFGGGEHSFHNFLVDLIFRLGFIPFIVYLIILIFTFYKIYILTYKNGGVARVIYLFCIFIQFFIQIMVNSPLTQPYFITNFCFALLFLMFLPEKEDVKITRKNDAY